MAVTSPEQNKALMLEACDSQVNKRDYAASESLSSERYIHGKLAHWDLLEGDATNAHPLGGLSMFSDRFLIGPST